MLTSPITILAVLYHESGRSSVQAGATLAHAVDPAKTRPFIEWCDLPPEVRQGREITAKNLLTRFTFDSYTGTWDNDHAVEILAAAIHDAEHEAVDRGLVLVKLNRPWVPFESLPEQAQEGRRNQARFLLAHFTIVAIAGT